MKYKVGDKVITKPLSWFASKMTEHGIGYIGENRCKYHYHDVEKFADCKLTVVAINNLNNSYKLFADGLSYWVCEELIECKAPEIDEIIYQITVKLKDIERQLEILKVRIKDEI